jgi:hypothetical protein
MLFLQSSELGPPTPSPVGECVPSPFDSGGGDTFARRRGGVPIRTRVQTLWYICALWTIPFGKAFCFSLPLPNAGLDPAGDQLQGNAEGEHVLVRGNRDEVQPDSPKQKIIDKGKPEFLDF